MRTVATALASTGPSAELTFEVDTGSGMTAMIGRCGYDAVPRSGSRGWPSRNHVDELLSAHFPGHTGWERDLSAHDIYLAENISPRDHVRHFELRKEFTRGDGPGTHCNFLTARRAEGRHGGRPCSHGARLACGRICTWRVRRSVGGRAGRSGIGDGRGGGEGTGEGEGRAANLCCLLCPVVEMCSEQAVVWNGV